MRWGLVCLFWILYRSFWCLSGITGFQEQGWLSYTKAKLDYARLRIHIGKMSLPLLSIKAPYLLCKSWQLDCLSLQILIFLFLDHWYQGGNWSYSDFWTWLIPVAYCRGIWGVVGSTLLVCWTFPSLCRLLEQFHIGRFWRKFTLDVVKRLGVKN